MTRKLISSGTIWERKYGYSRAVQVDGLVMVAGTTAVDEHGNVVSPGNPGGQAKFIYEKIARALAEAGASLADVVRVRTFVVDIARWEDVAEVQGQVFATIRPAATLVEVSALVSPELLVEIEVDAIVPSGRLPRTLAGPERKRSGRRTSAAKCLTRVAVHDEFGTLRAAIVHDGRNATDMTMGDWRWSLPPSELAKNPQLGPSSKARLVKQLGGLRKAARPEGRQAAGSGGPATGVWPGLHSRPLFRDRRSPVRRRSPRRVAAGRNGRTQRYPGAKRIGDRFVRRRGDHRRRRRDGVRLGAAGARRR